MSEPACLSRGSDDEIIPLLRVVDDVGANDVAMAAA
jgi:hypothetical protein